MSKTAGMTPLLGLLALGACESSGDDAEPYADNACLPDPDVSIECSSDDDCPTYECTCSDGADWLLFGPCWEGACTALNDYECSRQCALRGGVEHAADIPLPTVVGTQECTDWCERLVAESTRLRCGGFAFESCLPYVDCVIAEGECSASTREHLACMAESAEFSCGDDGALYIDTIDCPSSASCADDPCLR